MTPSIVLDSSDQSVSYVGPQWQASSDNSTFAGTYNICLLGTNTSDLIPTMLFSFEGTGVSFYGQPSDNLQLNYTFDSSTTLVANLSYAHGIPGKTGVRIWGFDNVTAGVHTVSLIPTTGQPIFDYFVITPCASSNLTGRTIALDDTDPGIKYNGQWTEQSGTVYSSGMSYNGTIHGSTTPGDSFTVSFTGDSISVYGLLGQQAGSHSSTYSIDGGPPTFYNYSFNATDANISTLNQKFFSADVSPGQHNLTVIVTEVSGSQTRRLRTELRDLRRDHEIVRAQQARLARRMVPPPPPPPPPVARPSRGDNAGLVEAPPPPYIP
ncbi:hypothetical protein H0H81_010152 [Sphagnurus paluster]|uniref:Uncharacterized protein n=1 Tax=Sphagnurus paluster TaxID=117069 RepID=A0A9P7FVW3_9AGAR|nr:hypothetical protein H0H81_010152 [Sphagnurus paluster]